MAVTAESVLVEIEARFDKFRAEAALAAGSFEAQAGRMAKAATGAELAINKAAAGIGTLKASVVGFLGAITVDKVIQLASASLDYAASIGETAQQLGVTTKAYQELTFAATQTGIKQETLEAGLAKLTRTLGEAKAGSEQQVAAFKAIGVSAAEIQTLTTDEAFRRIADALAKIPDPAKRAALEVDFFGKSGQKLDTLLSGGTAAIDELADAAAKLGVVLSDEQLQRADETADKLAALKTVLSANIAGIVSDNADAILRIANAVGVAVSKIGDLIRTVQIADEFKKRLEAGDLTGALNTRRDFDAIRDGAGVNLDFGNSAAFGGFGGTARAPATAAPAAAAPRATAPRATRAAAPRAPELTPAQQRAFGNDVSDPGITAASSEALANLDAIGDKLGEVQTIAIDLSNSEIINSEAIAAAKEFGENLSNNLAQAIVYGQSLGDALVNSIEAAAAKLISSGLFKLLGLGIDAVLPGLGSGIGSILGFAAGGRPPQGRVSLVGERGPELFVPDSAGTIIPNNRLGGGGVVINQNLNVSLAGNAATKEDAAMFARIAYEQSVAAFRQSQQLGIPTI